MGIILDFILLAILILSIFMGYKRGLINVVFNLCAFVVAFIITFILYIPITRLVINNTQIDENIKSTIIENGIIENSSDENKNEGNGLNVYIQKFVTQTVTNASNETLENVAGLVAERIVSILVSIALFIAVRVLLILARALVEGISNLPIIKQFNELGGVIYGILRGAVVIYAILAILFFVISINNTGVISNAIETSILSKILYENNIILNIIF